MADIKAGDRGIVFFYREGMTGEAGLADKLAQRLIFSGTAGRDNVVKAGYSGKSAAEKLIGLCSRKGFTKVVLAGYLPAGFSQAGELRGIVAEGCGLTESSFSCVSLPRELPGEEELARLAGEIVKAFTCLDMIPVFERIASPVKNSVLVLGGGFSGVQTAMELAALGHAVTLAEKTRELGGGNPLFKADPAALKGVDVITECELGRLSGSLGAFKAELRFKDPADGAVKTRIADCGAIVLAFGSRVPGRESYPVDSPLAVSLDGLKPMVMKTKYKGRLFTAGILLDYAFPETVASMEQALQTALALQKRYERQVILFMRDARVSALHVEGLYASARDLGVEMVKYEGNLVLREDGEGLTISIEDSVLGKAVSYTVDILGISPRGLVSGADKRVLDLTGVFPDALDHAQANNIHALPVETNIPGIAAVGSVRGTHYLPRIIEEVKAAAAYIHTLLVKPELVVESSHAVVDPDKCVLCLTCVRSCPMGAMRVNRQKGAAESLAHTCRRCGICAGECPAKAIELPAYPDKALIFQAAAG